MPGGHRVVLLVQLTILGMVVVLLCTCQSTANRLTMPPPQRTDSFLWVAWTQSQSIADKSTKLYSLGQVANGYFESGDDGSAQNILSSMEFVLSEIPGGRNKVQGRLELAATAVKLDQPNLADPYLSSAYAAIMAQTDSVQKGQDLATFLRICFDAPELTRNHLRDAVLQVYVIDDPLPKVQLLTDLAAFYGGEGGRRAFNLLQQAIPAANSIGNPFSKAEALTLIAQGFLREQQGVDAKRYAKSALDLLLELDVLVLSPSDQDTLARTLVSLTALGYPAEAQGLVQLVESPINRARVQGAIARQYLRTRQVFLYRLAFQRILAVSNAQALALPGVIQELALLIPGVLQWAPGELTAINTALLRLLAEKDPMVSVDYALADFAVALTDGGFVQEALDIFSYMEIDEVILDAALEMLPLLEEGSEVRSILQGIASAQVKSITGFVASEVQLRLALDYVAKGDYSTLGSALGGDVGQQRRVQVFLDLAKLFPSGPFPPELEAIRLEYSQ